MNQVIGEKRAKQDEVLLAFFIFVKIKPSNT